MKMPTSLLSRTQKERQIQRGLSGLHQCYVDRSQRNRNWNPDRSFDWRNFGKTHSPELIAILEGFYAVEQFAPDYTSQLVRLVRKNYGQAQFQMRWGVEEEQHADAWRNTLIFSHGRSPEKLEQYTDELRQRTWVPPHDDPIRMLLYTVFQERATQVIYLNTAKIARGESTKPCFAGDSDPVLAKVATTVAVDEAAHYEFFLSGARLFLYYYPEETLDALVDVLRGFTMPAADIIENYDDFITTLYNTAVFGRTIYGRQVAKEALTNLEIASIQGIDRGIASSKGVEDTDRLDLVDFGVVEKSVEKIFGRIQRYEKEVGLFDVHPTWFVPNMTPGDVVSECPSLEDLDDLLDTTYTWLLRADPNGAMDHLCQLLNDYRQRVCNTTWFQHMKPHCLQHKLRELVHQDPHTRRAFEKPRGYAGDAVMLDYSYSGVCPSETTEIGEIVFQGTSRCPNALSVVERRDIITRMVDSISESVANARILSIGAGHLREAQQSKAVQEHAIKEYFALDQDQESLDVVEREQGMFGVRPVRESIISILRGKVKFDNLNFIYSAGLFDYLQDNMAKKLTNLMFQQLAPGGTLLLANYSPNSYGRGYMEMFMDWVLVYRDEQQLSVIAEDIPEAEIASKRIFTDSYSNIVYAEIKKNDA